MTALSPRTFSHAERRDVLDDVLAHSADYSWLWEECRRAVSLDRAFAQLRARVDPERPYFVGELSNGIRFAGDARDYPAALHAIYPHATATLIAGLIDAMGDRAGDVLDVGTNIGVVAASVARSLAGRGRVHAFEPAPSTCVVAAATLALNGLENVTLTEAAIGNEDGQATFNATPGNSAIASLLNHGFGHLNEWTEIVVPSLRIDTLLDRGAFADVILLKVDVEGRELDVLRGARETIAAHRPTVVYEYTPVAAAKLGWAERDSIGLLSGMARYEFEAVTEPHLHVPDARGRRLPFPLPAGVRDQVNVYARVRG